MQQTSTRLFRLALDALHYSSLARLSRPRFGGVGGLVTLHHVCPAKQSGGFAPNGILDVTPAFLDAAIERIRALGFEIVSIGEFARRMRAGDFGRPMLVFTLDDGYEDNFRHAYPVFARHEVPFTVYLCTGLMAETANLWWRDLAEVVRQADAVHLRGQKPTTLPARTTRQKRKVFHRIYWQLRRMPLDRQLQTMGALRELNPCEIDVKHEAPLSWEMVNEMQASGLLTIGAHTVNHYALSKLSEADVIAEMEGSIELIRAKTGVVPEHFAYPFGDQSSAGRREFSLAERVGFVTAVTTRKGVVFPEHAAHMLALPRISLNGNFQRTRYLDALLSGLPFALHNGFKKADVV